MVYFVTTESLEVFSLRMEVSYLVCCVDNKLIDSLSVSPTPRSGPVSEFPMVSSSVPYVVEPPPISSVSYFLQQLGA
jgi:hypothetical protein